MSLSDADLSKIRSNLSDNGYPQPTHNEGVLLRAGRRLLEEVELLQQLHAAAIDRGIRIERDLRARVAGTDGPDQGDPAAWLIERSDGDWTTATADADEADRLRRAGFAVTPLRALGAVAAAPPGGETSDRVRDGVCLDCGGAVLPSGEHLDPARHLAALAPSPAGHEDEAAVERAADTYLQRVHVGATRAQRLAGMRAALAAARGPRTPDPGAGA